MEHTTAVEDYLKAVFHLDAQGGPASTGSVAQRLGVTPASASAMLRRLAEAGLVDRSSGGLPQLTADGRREALRVVRRHHLIETFLTQVLDVPWDEVHDEAEVLEHAVSDRLVERIARHLGDPDRDPHGDPIPPRTGEHDETWGPSLRDLVAEAAALDVPAAVEVRVERISDRDPAALRHLGELGIRPGTLLRVVRQDPFGGPLWVGVGARELPLGGQLLDLVHGSRV